MDRPPSTHRMRYEDLGYIQCAQQLLVAITCVSLVVLEGSQLEVAAYKESKSRIQIGELFFRKSRVTCNGVTCNELH